MNPLFLLIRNLLLTVLAEGVLVLVFTKNKSTVYHSVLVNMLTNPLVNLVLMAWAAFVPFSEDFYYYMLTAVLEVSAVAAEWILYYKMEDFGLKKAFFASLSLNTASYFLGVLIQ